MELDIHILIGLKAAIFLAQIFERVGGRKHKSNVKKKKKTPKTQLSTIVDAILRLWSVYWLVD